MRIYPYLAAIFFCRTGLYDMSQEKLARPTRVPWYNSSCARLFVYPYYSKKATRALRELRCTAAQRARGPLSTRCCRTGT